MKKGRNIMKGEIYIGNKKSSPNENKTKKNELRKTNKSINSDVRIPQNPIRNIDM